MTSWNKSQWDAFGRHILTAAGSAIAALVMAGVLTTENAAIYLGHLTVFVTAIVALASMLGPIYAAYRAADSASPTNQAIQTVKNLNAKTDLNGEKAKLIEAVAEQPEVARVVVADPVLANEIPSPKVVVK